MPFIEVTDKQLKFLQELGHELRTQDRRATADPCYIVLQTVRKLPAPEGYGDSQVYLDRHDNEYGTYLHPEAARKQFETWELSEDEIEQRIEDLELFGMHEVDEDQNVFLTMKGYREHIRLNDHNIPKSRRSYMKHAFRNPEMAKLIDILKSMPPESVTSDV